MNFAAAKGTWVVCKRGYRRNITGLAHRRVDSRGMLIINADDWGGWQSATDAAMACYEAGRITSVSAMVFMDDSERAVGLANEAGIDVGLHVNFTLPFSAPNCPPTLRQRQDRLRRFLKRNKYALLLYNPFLGGVFKSVYQAQADEFVRLYGRSPSHVNGHQHMHLCTNMLINKVIDRGTKVRRSFSFWPTEKGWLNRSYRKAVDKSLAHRYRLTHFFFSLAQCLRENRLRRVVELAKTSTVELMTHPEKPDEFAFLMSDSMLDMAHCLQRGTYADLQPI